MAFLKRASREGQEVTFVSTNVRPLWVMGMGCWSPTTTLAPSSKRSSTVARPMPEEPPADIIYQDLEFDTYVGFCFGGNFTCDYDCLPREACEIFLLHDDFGHC